ncbi:MAG: hypothetical protein KDK48_06295, partial [Chlamydiia bacterium]|nr:hypothetical protein [Chlamydiia bacterium]
KGWILLSGRSPQGFFRTYIARDGIFESAPPALAAPKERLSFGVHKKQEWDAVLSRGALQEILPFWMRLGQMTPSAEAFEGGTAALLGDFATLFRTGFGGLLAPRMQDIDYQGFEIPPITKHGSPFYLLTEGARQIRSLFFRESGDALHILPSAPSAFHAGRMIDVEAKGMNLSFEWTKGKMRRALIKSGEEIVQRVIFPKEIKRFRVNGRVQSAEAPLALEKEKLTLLDRFEK